MSSLISLACDALITLAVFGAIHGCTFTMKNMAVDAHKDGMTSYSIFTRKMTKSKLGF